MAASDPVSPSFYFTPQTKPNITINPTTVKHSSALLSPTATLDSLQSLEQLHLLNEIDKLRAHGVNDFVSLPQIVVCGDQSSGKSSVLEAITEIPFPRKDNLCTRFATQIVLRRGTKMRVTVKILADSKRPENEKNKLGKFTGSLEDFGDLPALIERAQEAMGISAGSGAFSRDVLSIEISGPGRPQLTVVDLPGLTHTENKSQSRKDVELVSELVHKYMSDPRTIVLAIVTAKNDYANQIVLTRAKEVDPEGVRTLGIITKPDTLPEGSDSEQDFFSLAKNEDIFFKLGWHVLRNRAYEDRNSAFEDRNQKETAFFEKSVWRELPRECVGISALRTRLSSLLLNRIKQELPRVYKEIGDELRDCENKLSKLGKGRSTIDEQRIFLSQISEDFSRLCKAATDGIYEDEFFGDAMEDPGRSKRLRSVIQNINSTFAENIRQKGHSKSIIDEKPSNLNIAFSSSNPEQGLPQKVTRADAIKWVKPLLLQSRGRELPGTYNPLLIGEVFWEQSKPWEAIAYNHLAHVFSLCEDFLWLLFEDIVPGDVLSSLFNYWIDEKLSERFERANRELKNLLMDRRRHAITYNHYCTDNIQRTRADRMEERYTAAIKSVTSWNPNVKGPITLDPAELLRVLSSPTQDNLDDYACDEVLDGMSAYYQVASKVFIDNVAVQVVERQVIDGLWDIFSPSAVVAMNTEVVGNIAEESTEDRILRERLEAKQKSLKMGMEVCRRALKGTKTETVTRTPLKSNHKKFSTPTNSGFDNLSDLLANTAIGKSKKPRNPDTSGLNRAPPKSSVTPPVAQGLFPTSKVTGGGGLFDTESLFGNGDEGFPSSPFGTLEKNEPAPPYRSPSSVEEFGGFKGGAWGASATTETAANINHGIFGRKPITARTGNPILFPPSKYSVTTIKDVNGMVHYHSIVFLPEYQKLSFEELRLQDYEQGKRWGA